MNLGSRKSSTGVVFVLFALATTGMAAIKSSTSDFRKVVNKKGYNLVDPAESWVYPGGLVVVGKAHATFVKLPNGFTIPTPTAGTVDFPQSTSGSSFSVSAILSGLTAILGVNPGLKVAHSSMSDLKELRATASQIDDDAARKLVNDATIESRIREWMDLNEAVYVVNTTLLTKSFSLTRSSSWGVDLTVNGKSLDDCPTDTGSAKDSSSKTASGKSGGTSANSGLGNTDSGKGQSGSKSLKTSTSQKSSTPGSQDSSSSTPGSTLQVCKASNYTISMSTDTPLIFAASVNKVVREADGSFSVDPVATTLPLGSLSAQQVDGGGSGDGSQRPDPVVYLNLNLPSHWIPADWPGPNSVE